MKKLIVVVLFTLAPAVVPDPGEALTLSQRVARIEGKLNCLRRVPVAQYNDVAAYGDPATGLNASTTYDILSPTASPANDNPDGLTDLGSYPALNWAFTNLAPDYWVLAINADANNVPASGCLAKFGAQVKPSWWPRAAGMMRLRQLARTEQSGPAADVSVP
jgi:hypothetical protein